MRGFLTKDVYAAIQHAEAGGQGLHLHTLGAGKAAPLVFRQAVARGEWIAHLFDQDIDRLMALAIRLGATRAVIDRPNERAQHIDLCGAPLLRALAMCENVADLPTHPPRTVGSAEAKPVAAPPASVPTLFGQPVEDAGEGELRFGNFRQHQNKGRDEQPIEPDRPE